MRSCPDTDMDHFFFAYLCIYIAGAEYFLISDDAVNRRKLGF